MAVISQQQLDHFQEEGYLLVRGLLDVQEVIEPVVREYEGVLDSLARELHEAGQIQSAYADLPFAERLIKVYGESGKVHQQYFDFSLPVRGVQHASPREFKRRRDNMTAIQRSGAAFLIAVLLLSTLTIRVAEAQDPQGVAAPKSIGPFLKKHCYRCHGTDTHEADLALHDMTRVIRDSADALNWQDILDKQQ